MYRFNPTLTGLSGTYSCTSGKFFPFFLLLLFDSSIYIISSSLIIFKFKLIFYYRVVASKPYKVIFSSFSFFSE